jgi:arylsulfatase A-like enzyme
MIQNRRNFLRTSAAGFAAMGLPFIGCGQANPPNIVFLLTDDQRADALGCAGNTVIQTPNIDQLAQDGVLFDNAYVTTSICCSSRASILTGMYSRRHDILDFATNFSESQLAATYPSLLRAAGYYTGFVGKYGVGKDLPSASFDYWQGIPGQPVYENQDAGGKYKHLTRILSEQSLEFLRACPSGQPFCLSVSYKAPHVQDEDPRQFLYDPAYKDLYQDITIPVPDTADDRFWQAFPEFFRENNEARRRWEIRFSTPELYQEMVKGYYRLVYGVDKAVGEIRNELERLDLADNTIIIYTSDNGFYLGEHGLAGKWYGHEESIRVPLIISDPRRASLHGTKRNEMVLNIDLAATMLEMAGVAVPDAMQGKSLIPLVQGRSPEWRQDFYYEHFFDHERIPKNEGVVAGRYKYLRYPEQQPVYEEFYDLQADPGEIRNLISGSDYSGLIQQYRERCDQLKAQAA